MSAPEVVEGKGTLTGQILGVLLLILPAAVCLWRASRRQAPSRRAAWLAAFCGLLLMVPLGFGASPGVTLTFGVLRALISAAGIVLVIRALVLRRRDRGVGVVGPLAGAGFCLIHGLVAFGLLIPPSAMTVVQGQPWVYRSEEEQFELTLPSEHWVKAKEPGSSAAFRCVTLPVRVSVQLDKESATEYSKREKLFQTNELPNLRAGSSESGKTEAGDDFFMGGGYEKQPTKEILIHVANVHRAARKETISLLCEATLTTKPGEKRTEQETAIRDAVRSIARSLK